MLFDADICDAIARKLILIKPFDLNRLGPNSYDVTLGSKFLRKEGKALWRPIEEERLYTLEPDEFVLGHTAERTLCHPNVIPMLEGVSSVAREGVSVHLSAGFGDAGFAGQWTLEIKNHTAFPVDLWVGRPIAQVFFDIPNRQWSLGCARPYYTGGHKYSDQEGPVVPGARSKMPKTQQWHDGTLFLENYLRQPYPYPDADEIYQELYAQYSK
jgi:dCTP deaminase